MRADWLQKARADTAGRRHGTLAHLTFDAGVETLGGWGVKDVQVQCLVAPELAGYDSLMFGYSHMQWTGPYPHAQSQCVCACSSMCMWVRVSVYVDARHEPSADMIMPRAARVLHTHTQVTPKKQI